MTSNMTHAFILATYQVTVYKSLNEGKIKLRSKYQNNLYVRLHLKSVARQRLYCWRLSSAKFHHLAPGLRLR